MHNESGPITPCTVRPSPQYPPVPKAASDAAEEADFERELSKYDQWEAGFITQLSELEEKVRTLICGK
jgi:hypothetical protein